jgi:hypothetical protein
MAYYNRLQPGGRGFDSYISCQLGYKVSNSLIRNNNSSTEIEHLVFFR